jgi:squalene-hopene/tetraprenyl-beta-curcumene cyclase
LKQFATLVLVGSWLFMVGAADRRSGPASSAGDWSPAAAADYLDGRLGWWLEWPTAARDHGTSCVSCHTALPYALARASLRRELAEAELPAVEQRMLDGVVTRVRLWRDVEPFYPDQTRGIPKTSESRGTEAVLNALVLATRDAETGALTRDAITAFDHLWALQMKTGDLEGAWPWLDFGLQPWEAPESPLFGASLAAIAIGSAPGDYAQSTGIQPDLELLRQYLREGAATGSLFGRMMVLWASSALPDVLSPSQREAIIADVFAAQGEDGGWSLGALAPWGRVDGSTLPETSDGYATALAVLALQKAGVVPETDGLRIGRDWLVAHQNTTTGAWPASSVNRERDPDSDRGRFMSDAATAYATLALLGR